MTEDEIVEKLIEDGERLLAGLRQAVHQEGAFLSSALTPSEIEASRATLRDVIEASQEAVDALADLLGDASQ